MNRWDGMRLSAPQSDQVVSWLGQVSVLGDLSWGQVDTKVLHVHTGNQSVIVKAAGPDTHHIGREITAHESHTSALIARGKTNRLLHANRGLNLMVLEYLEGNLVEGTPEELSTDIHTQAAAVLRLLHEQEHRLDAEYERKVTEKSFAWLDRQHRIAPDVEREARARLREYRPSPVVLVPTHGDWQPRNWINDQGQLRAIDFGRFDFRPAATDLCRLAVQQWAQQPALEAAFLHGYGDDPRTDSVWRMELLREAISTTVWAHLVGDEAFEAQGQRMLTQALQGFSS